MKVLQRYSGLRVLTREKSSVTNNREFETGKKNTVLLEPGESCGKEWCQAGALVVIGQRFCQHLCLLIRHNFRRPGL
jgi:hypothetical protein